jgi:putative transposase
MGNKREPFLPDTIYHIYNHSIGTSKLFFEEANYLYFLDLFRKHVFPFTEVYAFCLMPNHFHFLLRVGSSDEIEQIIKKQGYKLSLAKNTNINQQISHLFGNLFNAYAKGINKRYHRMGSLFITSVKRKIVTDENYLKQLILYINLNPLHHGLAKDLEDWPYSSYRQTIHGNSFLLSYHKTLSFFDSIDQFIILHQHTLDKMKKADETGPLNSIFI